MGFKQPSLKEYPQTNVLTGMPSLVTIMDVDLVVESATSTEEENYEPTNVMWFPTGTNTASFTLDLIILNNRSNP